MSDLAVDDGDELEELSRTKVGGKRDIPVVQACSMIFASVYILLNLSADIISIVTNPRILHPR